MGAVATTTREPQTAFMPNGRDTQSFSVLSQSNAQPASHCSPTVLTRHSIASPPASDQSAVGRGSRPPAEKCFAAFTNALATQRSIIWSRGHRSPAKLPGASAPAPIRLPNPGPVHSRSAFGRIKASSWSPSVGGMERLLARLELIEATGVLRVDVGWVNGN